MDYEFDVMVDEPIIIDGETVIQVTRIYGEVKVKLGIIGPHEVWRGEVAIDDCPRSSKP